MKTEASEDRLHIGRHAAFGLIAVNSLNLRERIASVVDKSRHAAGGHFLAFDFLRRKADVGLSSVREPVTEARRWLALLQAQSASGIPDAPVAAKNDITMPELASELAGQDTTAPLVDLVLADPAQQCRYPCKKESVGRKELGSA